MKSPTYGKKIRFFFPIGEQNKLGLCPPGCYTTSRKPSFRWLIWEAVYKYHITYAHLCFLSFLFQALSLHTCDICGHIKCLKLNEIKTSRKCDASNENRHFCKILTGGYNIIALVLQAKEYFIQF